MDASSPPRPVPGDNDHTHYQSVSVTAYPETRRRLAAMHKKRAEANYNAPGWVIGVEARAAAANSPPKK